MFSTPDRKRIAILRILSRSPAAIGSGRIVALLGAEGLEANERTVRHHLRLMEQEGLLLREKGRRRQLTDVGRRELESSGAAARVGRAINRIEDLACGIRFAPETRIGEIALDLALVPRSLAATAASLAMRDFLAGGGPAGLVAVFPAGDKLGAFTVPRDTVGIATVSLVTLASVFIGRAIPVSIRFGGILQVDDFKPTRFIEIIDYRESSVDPLELFLPSGMIYFGEITLSGRGRIGAAFAEAPAASQPEVEELAALARSCGLGSVLEICPPDRESAGIYVAPDRIGLIIASNLNPLAALAKTSIPFKVRTMAGTVPWSRLFPYYELIDRL